MYFNRRRFFSEQENQRRIGKTKKKKIYQDRRKKQTKNKKKKQKNKKGKNLDKNLYLLIDKKLQRSSTGRVLLTENSKPQIQLIKKIVRDFF